MPMGSVLMLLSLFVMLVVCAPTLFFQCDWKFIGFIDVLEESVFLKVTLIFLCFLFHWFLLKLYYLLSSAYFEFNLLFIFWFLKMET